MTQNTNTVPPLIDVHDMIVVHRAFRRELRLTPDLVRAVRGGDLRRASILATHARLVLTGLHLHHTSEDDLLWPKLLERAAPSASLIARMEAQHEEIDALTDQIDPALSRWEVEARPTVGEEVAGLIERLSAGLFEHLDDEEQKILPIAAHHLTQAEWDAIGKAGVAKMTPRQLPIMFGMVMEDATPSERKEMLASLPLPVQVLLKTWGARSYRRYVSQVRHAH